MKGESGAESLNDAFRYGGPAGRNTAIVSEALLGESPHDLSGMIAAAGDTFDKLASREQQLPDLITNFNMTAGAFAAESGEPLAIDRAARSDADRDRGLAASPERCAAAPARTRARVAARHPGAAADDRRLRSLARPDRPVATQRRARRPLAALKGAAPGLAETSAASKRLFPITDRVARCTIENLVPTADTEITADGFGTGQPNFQEFFYGAVQLGGSGQGFDGNGSYLRLQPGGGPTSSPPSTRAARSTTRACSGRPSSRPRGVQPALPTATPPFRMDVPCTRIRSPTSTARQAPPARPTWCRSR